MTEVVVHLRSWKIAGMALVSIGMGALAGILAFDTDAPRWSYVSAAFLLLGLLFFAGLGSMLLIRAISPYPAILLGSNEIEFRSVPLMSGRIQISDIAAVRAVRYGSAQYVSLNLKDEESFIGSQLRVMRPALRYMLKGGYPICVILVGVGRGDEHRKVAERLRVALNEKQEDGRAA